MVKDPELARWVRDYSELVRRAEQILGARGWAVLYAYGRLMSGPRSGIYLSALPLEEIGLTIDRLADGCELDIHLMHRYRSDHQEASRLLLIGGKLFMRYRDRDEPA